MDVPDQDPLNAAIQAKLAEIAAAASPLPPWYDAWARLGPTPSEEDCLAVYRTVRDVGSVPEEAGSYLMSWEIGALTLADADEALSEYDDRTDAIRQVHGLEEDEAWPPGEEPAEYAEVLRQQHDAWDTLYVAKLDEPGELAMARLYRTDRQRFEQLSEGGRQFFHGSRPLVDPDDVVWLDDLREDVAGCLEVDSPMGLLGLRYREDGFGEVRIYPTPVELVGGAHDGAVVAPGFSLNLDQLRAAFHSVIDFGWNALGLTELDGPHVHVEGVYRGHEVYLQVLAQAPVDEEPGMKLDTIRRLGEPE